MTKIFLFLAIALLVIPSTVFISRYSGLQAKTSGKSSPIMGRQTSQVSNEVILTDEPSINHRRIDFGARSGEDDGSMHTFHFDRVSRMRRRMLFCVSAKCILIITHLCWIIKELLHIHHAI